MDLEVEIKELRERNKQLEELVKLQLEMIEKLRAELAGRNSSTSHSPPSQDSPKQRAIRRDKRKKKRKASNLKRGAQPGHPLTPAISHRLSASMSSSSALQSPARVAARS